MNRPRIKLELVEGVVMGSGLIAALIASIVLNPPPSPQGWVLIAILLGALVALTCVLRAYLRSQWTMQAPGDHLIVSRWWERFTRTDADRLPVKSVRKFIRRGPQELRVVAADQTVHVGTFWWREREARELDQLASDVGIPVDEERPELPRWL